MREAQVIIFLLRFIVYHFNVRYTKYVLKTCAIPGFYAGGKPPFRGSVNRRFFGVNIVLFVLSQALNRLKSSVIFNCKSLFISIKSSST